jgi:hypothetical protein
MKMFRTLLAGLVLLIPSFVVAQVGSRAADGTTEVVPFPQTGYRKLVACRRDNVTADAAGRIGIFPLDLPELLRDAADSG